MTLELRCSPKELREIASGSRKTLTREIRPSNERRFVTLNDEGEIIGIIEYDSLRLFSDRLKASLTVKVESSKLWEIEDDNGQLVYYTHNGVQHLSIEIDYLLGAILHKSNV